MDMVKICAFCKIHLPDLVPFWLLKEYDLVTTVIPTVTNVVSLSLSSGNFQLSFSHNL